MFFVFGFYVTVVLHSLFFHSPVLFILLFCCFLFRQFFYIVCCHSFILSFDPLKSLPLLIHARLVVYPTSCSSSFLFDHVAVCLGSVGRRKRNQVCLSGLLFLQERTCMHSFFLFHLLYFRSIMFFTIFIFEEKVWQM